MILLQTGIDSLAVAQTVAQTTAQTGAQAGSQGLNVWYFIEILVITGVIIGQLVISREVFKSIRELKEIFRERLNVISGYIDRSDLNKKEKKVSDIVFTDSVKEETPGELPFGGQKVRISVTETSGKGIIRRIKEDINLYLLNNYGAAVNFSIIKDIIDREVDVMDEEISNSLPTPLYLGLAATMVGIIFGLFAMPESNGQHFTEGIDALVNGVKLAMLGSLSGLACTTILSSFIYKNAKRQITRDKNEQISYLQATLLPELVKAEDTGVSGLKASLDRFARMATDISDNVLIAANQTGKNLALQNDVIDKVGKLDVMKISAANLELFDRLESNMVTFNKFSEYLSQMSQISDNLRDFASRTASIDNVISQIDLSLQENNRLSRFLTAHFEKIEMAGDAALKAVDLSDSHFKEAIEKLREETDKSLSLAFRSVNESASNFSSALGKLKEETDNRIARLNMDASENDSRLTEIYKEIGASLAEVTARHISQLQEAYSHALPRFEQLNNLQVLPEIREKVLESVSRMQNESNQNTARLIEAINQLKRRPSAGKKPEKALSVLSKYWTDVQLFFGRRGNSR